MNKLVIENLHVSVENQEILKGFNLSINSGEIHAIMGPNGSGKSTLCYAIMGHPKYKITDGSVLLDGKDILKLSVDKRAQAGLFLGFQYPQEVPGVTFGNFIRHAVNARTSNSAIKGEQFSPMQFYPLIQNELEKLKMDQKFIGRNLNEGFSGGEKKRAEIIQMGLLNPKFALLDEIDSGLDIDALKTVAEGIRNNQIQNKPGVLLITHYQRVLDYLTPDFIHILSDGVIVKSGGSELAGELEKVGYEQFTTA